MFHIKKILEVLFLASQQSYNMHEKALKNGRTDNSFSSFLACVVCTTLYKFVLQYLRYHSPNISLSVAVVAASTPTSTSSTATVVAVCNTHTHNGIINIICIITIQNTNNILFLVAHIHNTFCKKTHTHTHRRRKKKKKKKRQRFKRVRQASKRKG